MDSANRAAPKPVTRQQTQSCHPTPVAEGVVAEWRFSGEGVLVALEMTRCICDARRPTSEMAHFEQRVVELRWMLSDSSASRARHAELLTGCGRWLLGGLGEG